jgi:AAA+ ATPase superfamily predicted ATPase
MPTVKHYIPDCLRLLWMVFFRPKNFMQEVKNLEGQQWRPLSIQLLLVAVVTVFLIAPVISLFPGTTGNTSWLILILKSAVFVCAFVALHFALNIEDDDHYFPILVIIVGVGIWFGTHDVIVNFHTNMGVDEYSTTYWEGRGEKLVAGITMLGTMLITMFALAFVMFGGYLRRAIVFIPAFSIALSVTFGITYAASFMALFWAVNSRLILLPFIVPTTILSIWRARRRPLQAPRFLHQTLAYWDEVMPLPQPLLWRLLIAAGEADREAGMQAITHLVTNTHQHRAAERALLELGSRELMSCKTVAEIAEHAPSSFWFTSNVASGRMQGAAEAFTQCQQIAAEIASAVVSTSDYQKLTTFNRARKRLEEFRQFAVLVLLGRERQNFIEIARRWLAAVDAELERLSHEDGAVEKIANPYLAPNPLAASSEMFFGRHESFRFVEEHFLREGETAPIVLYGQPRIGKTSLLKNLDQRLTTNLISIYADMQRSAQVESTGGLLFGLSKTIGQQLIPRGIHVRQPSIDAFASEPFIVFDNFLDEVERAIRAPENRIILALDEFEQIEKQLTAGKVSADLMDYLRGTMQSRSGIRMIFAGTHTLDEMVSGLWTQYFRNALSCHISYLDEDSARSLITNPIKEFPLNYEPEAVDLLVGQTHCHPCLIQLTCSVLVDLKNAQKSRHTSIADVKRAFEKVLKEAGKNVFPGIWGWIPSGEQKLLAMLASSEPATVTQLALALARPEAEVKAMVERLVENELLTRNEEGCRFQVALFRQWVSRHVARMGLDFIEPKDAAARIAAGSGVVISNQ